MTGITVPWWLAAVVEAATLLVGLVAGNEVRLYRRLRRGPVDVDRVGARPDIDRVEFDWSAQDPRRRIAVLPREDAA